MHVLEYVPVVAVLLYRDLMNMQLMYCNWIQEFLYVSKSLIEMFCCHGDCHRT